VPGIRSAGGLAGDDGNVHTILRRRVHRARPVHHCRFRGGDETCWRQSTGATSVPAGAADTAKSANAANVADAANAADAVNAADVTNAANAANVVDATNAADAANVVDAANATDVTNAADIKHKKAYNIYIYIIY